MHSSIKPAFVISIGALLSIAGGACGRSAQMVGGSAVNGGQGVSPRQLDAAASDGDAPSNLDVLHAQAERDVAAFLAHQKKQSQPRDQIDGGDRSLNAGHAANGDRAADNQPNGSGSQIAWNTPAGSNIVPRPANETGRTGGIGRTGGTRDGGDATIDDSADRAQGRPEGLDDAPRVRNYPDEIEPRRRRKSADKDSAQAADRNTSDADKQDDATDDERSLTAGAMEQLVVDLSRELYQQAAYADMPLRELLLIAATSLVDPDRTLDPQVIPSLTDRERELLGEFQTFFAELGRRLDGSLAADEVMTESVAKLRDALDQTPPLTIGDAALCTEVKDFGDYTAFPRNAFLAMDEQQAVVYLEIENLSSEQNKNGEWHTQLSQELVIYSDRDGIPVWSEPWQRTDDTARKPRTDFFTVQIVTFPRNLSVGKYYFKVRVRDERTDALAEHSIPFEMVADPDMTGLKR